jgi:hypothetical protein
LGIERNSDKANIIDLYEIGPREFKLKLHLEVESPILYIDFNHWSSEKAYMLVHTVRRPELFDLMLTMNVSNEQVPDIDWMGKGLEFSEKTRATRMEHENRFKDGLITKIIEIGSEFILLDYYAGVYLYGGSRLIANCHLNMGSIDSAALSRSQRWLAVGSKVDRNIVLIEVSLSK